MDHGAVAFAITAVCSAGANGVHRTHPSVVALSIECERGATRIQARVSRYGEDAIKAVGTRFACVAVVTHVVEGRSTCIVAILWNGHGRIERSDPLAFYAPSLDRALECEPVLIFVERTYQGI